MAEDSPLLDVASAVAEGSAIDWDDAEMSARDSAEHQVLRQLRLLAKMTETVRAGEISLIDEQWSHLRIRDVIDGGTFGTVYRAWDMHLECAVALKLIKPSGVSEAFDLGRAMKEARLLARVRHENVVKVFGADSHAGRFGLWMELISGRTLARVLADHGPMGINEAIPIGTDLCRALAAVHGAGLLHRDIKAQNVMREDGGRIVLMDFGTGRGICGAGELTDSLAGTPLYLAPELFSGSDPSIPSDIYSLGVLLYHLVTNEYPVRGRTRRDLESGHLSGKRHPLRDTRPDLPSAFVDVVERAIARNPEDRYQSAGEFGNALAAIAGIKYAPTPVPNPRRKTLYVLAAAVTGLLVAGSVVGWRMLGDRGTATAVVTTSGAGSSGPMATAGTASGAAASPDASYKVSASFFASRDGRDLRLMQGSRVRPGDRIFASIAASEPVYIYVINRDEAGQSFLLFPLPGFNPISTSQTTRLPGVKDGQQHYWEVTSAGGQEHFLLYVTPQRLVEFENLLAAFPRAELGRTASNLPLPTSAIGILRGVGGLSATTDQANLSAGSELSDLLPLPEHSESTSGVWARRITFANPTE